MNESTKNLKPSQQHVLHKDLSFSNQIFKKSLHPDHLKSLNPDNFRSNHSLYPNSQVFMIPPLVKYNEDSFKDELGNRIGQFVTKQEKDEGVSNNLLNIFSTQKSPKLNFLKSQGPNPTTQKSIPPLSKLEQMIYNKYKKSLTPPNQPQSPTPFPAKVYFDKTEKLQHPEHPNILNIDSLEQSRIANDSIEKDNNWVLRNVNGDDGQFLMQKMKKNETKERSFFNLNNQSFRNMNPLNLVENSLHTSYLPEFIQDDDVQLSENNQEISEVGIKSEEINLREVKKASKQHQNQKYSVMRQPKSFRKGIPVNEVKIKQKPIKDITMSLFNHYIGSNQNFINLNTMNQNKLDDTTNQNLIKNPTQTKSDIDHITQRSSPPFNRIFHSQQIDTKSVVSETYTASKILQLSMSQYSQYRSQQHSIHDKTPQQMIASLYKDEKNTKLFIKYLQVQMATNPESKDLCHHYEMLSCLLCKIQEITDQNTTPKSPNELAKSLLQFSAAQNSQTLKQRQSKLFKPQIIRNNQKIKIDFDPLLTYQKNFLNQKIAALKKSLEQKNKQTELIKLTYDGIVHNYAVSLENLAQKAQNTQQDQSSQNQDDEQKLSSGKQRKFQVPEMFQSKNHLDVLRSSMQENIIHRKATFGKISSSFRGSATFPDV